MSRGLRDINPDPPLQQATVAGNLKPCRLQSHLAAIKMVTFLFAFNLIVD